MPRERVNQPVSREYIVLSATDVEGNYLDLGLFSAVSGEEAIKTAAKEDGDGRYVAVAAHGWKEHTVRTETRTEVILKAVEDTPEIPPEPVSASISQMAGATA